ncbi:hypothetical protein Q5424_26735 [Conexibacter sp. JD483]|uniref:hypothetical protein n=1 Tax=unclassified Conexibacter TaxID=2627773 RepID=UPI002721052A|nr:MULTISPECIES: hypothetical protein [unclassified Conexibacter]MDO8188024.1 hypothetical protein [Conexibacter sp. CPCC 205706]MDO8200907.1 hypothetical protein [Conexibacter sp. CPCC 205762]MDR9372725.1 hypothetical protein [Conexibacter sp. JD483]
MTRRIAAAAATVAMTTLIALSVAVLATPAGAAKKPKKPTGPAATVIKDCTKSSTGLLKNRYSARVLNLAKKEVKGDIAEYTGCLDAIKAQLRRANATVSARISGKPGKLTLLYKGRVVDELAVKRGKSVTFKVLPGRYTARANGKKKCVASVTARAKKTARVAVVCR